MTEEIGAAAPPVQPSIRRLKQFGIRPRHELGQNFLIDSNILGVIERAAELSEADVALEVGGGLGVLSEHLAAHAAHTHVIELDPNLEAPLREALAPYGDRSTLHMGDALAIDLTTLDPLPTKVIANLPYNIAATVLIETICELPSVTRWVAMVQKEVGQRFAAQAGSVAYGIPSVLAQIACDVHVHKAISRRVFHPVPNVDSVLIVLERTGDAPSPELRRFVQAAFAHRRKTLARSVGLYELASEGSPHANLEGLRSELEALGHPADLRAERLSPQQFRELHDRISR